MWDVREYSIVEGEMSVEQFQLTLKGLSYYHDGAGQDGGSAAAAPALHM